MAKTVTVDGVSFNADHYAGWTEADFVKDQLNSVPGRFGDDAKKAAWLKGAFKLVVPAKAEAKTEAKK